MQETVIQFGPDKGLLGILTTPADSVRVDGAPIAVIINAGIVHRIGPFGLHVKMARQLAEAGYSTLRLDLSGLGDSQPRTEKLGGENRADDAIVFDGDLMSVVGSAAKSNDDKTIRIVIRLKKVQCVLNI